MTTQPLTAYEGVCTRLAEEGDGSDAGRAVRDLLDRVGDKWSLLLIATLRDGRVLRFTELLSHVPGISQRMLTLTLRQLERDGLVTRTAHAEVPPRVEYALTPLAETLIPLAVALGSWAIEHNDAVEAARAAYDASHPPRS